MSIAATPARPVSESGRRAGRLRRRAIAGSVTVVVLGVAFLARLLPVLAGGGLRSYGNYDDGVYFAAGEGLSAGRLPYRDFLILHPPGIAVALAPFGWLAAATSDPTAFAVARICWMALGAVNAALVAAILWRFGRFGAVVGGLGYAVFFPAVFGEHSTLLEGPENLVLLVAVLIITRNRAVASSGWRRQLPWLLAGFALGLSPGIKIWGVVPVLAVAIWVGVGRGRAALLRLLVGVLAAGLVLTGPFFVLAPGAMWRMVVLDQLGRPANGAGVATRLVTITGLDLYPSSGWSLLLIVVSAGWLIVLALAAVRAETRFFAALHVVVVAFLLVVPSWFVHYAAFAAPSALLSLGAAASTLTRWSSPLVRRVRGLRPAAGLLGLLVLAGVLTTGLPLLQHAFGRPFPDDELTAAVRTDACVTTDDPTNLILLDRLHANLRNGCRLVVDLQGYNNDEPIDGRQVQRPDNPLWQRTALNYLASGDRSILSRLGPRAFTADSVRTVHGWPEVARSGKIVVRDPDAAGG